MHPYISVIKNCSSNSKNLSTVTFLYFLKINKIQKSLWREGGGGIVDFNTVFQKELELPDFEM